MGKACYAPEKILEVKNAYDNGNFKNWREILESVGIKYDAANATKVKNELERIYQQHHPSPSPNTPAETSLPYGVLLKDYDEDINFVCISDCHWWPRFMLRPSRAWYLLLHVLKHIKKDKKKILFIINGDAFDGASISRFPPNGWEVNPSVAEELDAVREYIDEIKSVLKGCDVEFYWSWGNHCKRLDKYIALHAPKLEGLKFTSLSEHFPEFTFTQSLFVNKAAYFVHRFKGGKHAPYNDALHAGVTMITSHDHTNHQRPIKNLAGMHFGIKTGSLAEVDGPQFAYHEGGVADQHSGFVVGRISNKEVGADNLIVRPSGEVYYRGEFLCEEDYK